MIKVNNSNKNERHKTTVGEKFIYYPFRHHQDLFVRQKYGDGILKESFYGLVMYDEDC